MGLRIEQNTGVTTTYRRLPAENDRPAAPAEASPGGPPHGRPVNEVTDPPSGESTRARADQLRSVVRSAQDGISAVQTVEAALAQAHSVLHHMRGLAAQAASGGLQDPRSQQAADRKFVQLKRDLDRVYAAASSRGASLGGVSFGAARIDGADASPPQFSVAGGIGAFSLNVGSASLVDAADPEDQALNTAAAQAAITSIDSALQTVSDTRARLGAIQNRFEYMISSLNVVIGELSTAEPRLRDTAMARQVAAFVRDRIVPQADVAIPAQANQAPTSALRLLS